MTEKAELKTPRIRVLGARVVVLEDKLEDTTKSGILIPGRDKESTYRGTIVAVGDGAMLDDGTIVPLRVSVGERVVYMTWTGSPILIKDDSYVILNERDILAIIDPETESN